MGLGSLALVGLVGCNNSDTATKAETGLPSWDAEYDVIVVGVGGAGLGAALEAAANEAKVLALDVEASHQAANTSLCGGVVMAWGTSVQEENGLKGDSAEGFIKYIEAVSGDLAYIDLLKNWAQKSRDTFNWLVDNGVKFPAEYLYYSGQEESFADVTTPYKRGHIAEGHIGRSITDVLFKASEKAGVQFEFNSEVKKLYKDSSGRIVGVGTEKENFKANKGVVLASGGSSRNKDLIKNFLPDMINGGSFGSMHQQGDGIRMGLEVGSAIGNMWAVQAKCVGNYLADQKCPCNTVFSWGMPCMFIGEDGKRVLAEDTFYEKIFDVIVSQPHQYMWIVWDQAVTDLGAEVISVPPMSEGLVDEVKAGQMYKADSVEALAKMLNVDSATLVQTFANYNEMMAAGVDTEFGRKKGLGPISKPPYYAAKVIPAICDTAGGVVINTDAQVLDWFDKPIPGLYAAGATTAGWRGKYYVGSGTAVSYAITYGRIAGGNAAKATA